MPANLLKQKNSYFRDLSPEGRERFIRRLFEFMQSKRFVGHEGLEITDEIRVLFSASAIQLTFGLENYEISHLHTINIFPRTFYSRYFETSFKGLTTQGGVLSLSWNDFREGYADSGDRINLGLHELAHALNIHWHEEQIYSVELAERYNSWLITAEEEMKLMQAGQRPFLRDYAARNIHEFFAVCVEHFFEVPEVFFRERPQLFVKTVRLLNQDPRNRQNDYRPTVVRQKPQYDYAEEIPSAMPQTSFQRIIHRLGVNIAMGTTVAGLFAGVPLLFYFTSHLLLDLGTLLLMIFACGAVGLLPWRFIRHQIDLDYYQFAMYAFSGFGLCLVNFLLFINLNTNTGSHTETIPLSAIFVDKETKEIIVNMSESSPLARNLSRYFEGNRFDAEADSLEIDHRTGILGVDRIESCRFIY